MNSNEVMKRISDYKIVPVVVINQEKDAVMLAQALENGGLPVAEVTFRTDAAETAIRQIAENYPDFLVGAGTVINRSLCERAIQAGAKFIVTPGYSQEVVDCALEHSIPVFPGCATPGEVIQAVNSGLEIVKFFPVVQYGGLPTLKALGSVFPKLKFMPSGGINASNIREFMEYKKIIACGGSWMVKQELIEAGAFEEITSLCCEARELLK